MADAISSWNWNSFFSTLWATFLGGAISVGGVFLGFKLERRERYRTAIDESVAKVLGEIAAHAAALRIALREQELVEEYARGGLHYFDRYPDAAYRAQVPDDFALSMAIEVARMRARRSDQDTLDAAVRSYSAIHAADNLKLRLDLLGRLGGGLADWRAGLRPVAQVRASFARIALAAERDDAEVG